MEIELLDENDGRFEYAVPSSDEFSNELVLIFEVTPDPTGEVSSDVKVFLADEDGVSVEIPATDSAPYISKAETIAVDMAEAEMYDRLRDVDTFDGWGGV